jgi:hypothetical protein
MCVALYAVDVQCAAVYHMKFGVVLQDVLLPNTSTLTRLFCTACAVMCKAANRMDCRPLLLNTRN